MRVFSRTALCNSMETHAAYIFHFDGFQMDSGNGTRSILMANEKKSLPRNDTFFRYAALSLKHLSTTENQKKIKIYKTLQEPGQKTHKVCENTPCAKIPSTTLFLISSIRDVSVRPTQAVRPYPEKDRKRLETPKKTRKRPKKTLFSTEFYII